MNDAAGLDADGAEYGQIKKTAFHGSIGQFAQPKGQPREFSLRPAEQPAFLLQVPEEEKNQHDETGNEQQPDQGIILVSARIEKDNGQTHDESGEHAGKSKNA